MENTLKKYLFIVLNRTAANDTLVGKTWNIIKEDQLFLYELRKEQLRYNLSLKTNNLTFAFIVTAITAIVGLLVCSASIDFVQSKMHFLMLVNIPEDKGGNMISENMGASATIIGLSFVVIGFLFESVRNKTQQTFEDIFRVTKLYYVFAISITGMFFIVGMNFYKYTFLPYTTGNFAIYSSIILMAIILSIAYLFSNILKFLSDERIAQYATNNLVKTAKFQYLNERFMVYSRNVLSDTFHSFTLEPHPTHLTSDGYSPLAIKNKPTALLMDIYFPIIRLLKKKIGKRLQTEEATEFSAFHYSQPLPENANVLYFEDGVTISGWEKKLFNWGFLIQNPLNSETAYSKEKGKLEKRLIASAETGNMEALEQALSDMNELYAIYLKGE
ncbi:hypothetical protein ABIB62_000007 [Mucilaginibacter sp. UYP25]|uniref:hypothetical protein n=1 Tax=unclassified Mucilaginibacter TaxID=2617802 RepID=UPI0033910728